MITVMRGSEPSKLQKSRAQRLRAAIDVFNAHGSGSPQLRGCLSSGYELAKPTLFRRQHKKCAYCETYTPLDETPTEHFRPKKEARRDWREDDPVNVDDARYWWLTWTWENLLFSCTTCNGQSHKGNRFPLASRTPPLEAPERPATFPLPDHHFDVTNEHPLLIDPADPTIDPLDHLRWRPLEPTMPAGLWTFGVRGISIRGRATVRILKLDDRAHFINAAYYSIVWPRFRREILAKVKLGRNATNAAWSALARDLVHPQAEFAAAKWCMLDCLRTSSQALRKLQLPEPKRPRPL